MSSARQSIGYCPQFEALSDGLTGRQHLVLFSKLRGIPSHQLKDVVNDALNMLELMPHADKPVSAYSGGNCRRLSTAIALLANPPLILLVRDPFELLIVAKFACVSLLFLPLSLSLLFFLYSQIFIALKFSLLFIALKTRPYLYLLYYHLLLLLLIIG